MPLCIGHNLSKSFGVRELFSGLDFVIDENKHIGLIGANGCGKTTLMRMIAGINSPDSGEIVFSREAVLGYMEQYILKSDGTTLYQQVATVFDHLAAIEQQLATNNTLLESQADADLILRQQQLRDDFAAAGGYTYKARLRSALLGLGFSESDFERPISSFSGGECSKALLAKALLAEANLLLLDEPTNHLDIKAIEWLENYLSGYRGAFIVVSHDRYFLDKVTDQTWEMASQQLYKFDGNYSAYLIHKQAQQEAALGHYANVSGEIKRIESIIEQQRRFNQARNYKTIASKEKQIARLAEELPIVEQQLSSIKFRFATALPGGNEVLRIKDLSVNIDGKQLFANLDLEINKGERVFLLGPNGCGKTTLLKLITGAEDIDSNGIIRLGTNINIGYYDQVQSELKHNHSLLEELTESFPKETQTRLRTALGCFLFCRDDVEKLVGDLSGGERSRMELLKLMLSPANLLLLDEPSNHLDINSREAVEQALLSYNGTMLIVSHDRYLINKLATKIYYLTPRGTMCSLGNYDDFLIKHQNEIDQQATINKTEKTTKNSVNDYRQHKEEEKNRRRAQKKVEQTEEQIAALEADLAAIETMIQQPQIAADYQQLSQLCDKREYMQKQLVELYDQWEQATQEIDQL